MPLLPVLQICPGNPAPPTAILRTPAREVTDFPASLHALAADLLETLRHHGAAGIAAPQAGIPLRIAVVEPEAGRPLVLVNPRITEEAGPVSEGPEACLSLPGIRCVVARPGALEVAYQDPAGVRHVLEAQGLLSRIIAHEVDHLEGVLCTDRAIRMMAGEP